MLIDKYQVKVFFDDIEISAFDINVKFSIGGEMEKEQNYRAMIKAKVEAAEEVISNLKAEVAELADAGKVQAYWGEYGSGETYYPKGTNAEDEYIHWHVSHLVDENGLLTEGVWIASSEMC